MYRWWWGGVLLATCAVTAAYACNEAVCASIVSKCMLTQSCKCDLRTNSTCSKDCFYCLDYLYTECCSCVVHVVQAMITMFLNCGGLAEMCPKPNSTDSSLSQKSHVEDLPEPIPELFDVLTEEKDRLLRWISYTFPVQLAFVSAPMSSGRLVTSVTLTVFFFLSYLHSIILTYLFCTLDPLEEETQTVNCTVAYMSQCMSWNKCKNSCRSMGAASYRWFHDGCCECVGSTCINYGINDSRDKQAKKNLIERVWDVPRCRECPEEDEEQPRNTPLGEEEDLSLQKVDGDI
ncbi:TWSG1 [Cordylochernes scorpioides]|uniref:TWSG1 n=1 Tax=Cordylochernes scorpioides TaxID=51811 RepID=A0ABY6LKH7_9ARAC|nr:TWSG1 [Cordylochernes scorpioides]